MRRLSGLVWRAVLATVITIVLVSPKAHSFDGHRRGFVLGYGIGAGTLSPWSDEVATLVGVQTDLTIGGGLSDKVELHYTGKQFWYFKDEILSF